MCGVNGIFAYHPAANSPDEVELLATRDAMRARGPDGSGLWWSSDRRCGLAHRRLSILDLSDRASQPMLSADGSFHYFTPPLPLGESVITITAQNARGGVNTQQRKVVIQ